MSRVRQALRAIAAGPVEIRLILALLLFDFFLLAGVLLAFGELFRR